MTDNLKRRKPEDPKKININQKHEVEYWTKALGVTAAVLKQAVKAVGVGVVDVRAWIKKNKK